MTASRTRNRILILLAASVVSLGALTLAGQDGVAQAHYLTFAKAKARAESHRLFVMREGDGYVSSTSSCSRLFPHVFTCKLTFQNKQTPGFGYAVPCVENIKVLYHHHDDYTVGYFHDDGPDDHPCE